MNTKKLFDYDLLKVITTLFVVFAHITRMYTGAGIINPINGSIILNYVTKVIYSFHMPLFIFISGAIYYYIKQEKGRYNDTKKFIVNKTKRLMLPYIVFGVFYVAPIMTYFQFTKDNFFIYTVKGILLSLDSKHLWYLFALFNIYMVVYFTEKYVNKLPKVFTIIGLYIIHILSPRLPNILQINTTGTYLIYFYLGYLFQANKDSIKIKFKFNMKTLIVFLILNLTTLYLTLNLNTKGFIIATITLISAIFGILASYSLINILSRTRILDLKIYKILIRDSFGIYLFHPMIIYVLFFYLGGKNINPFLLTGLVFIVTIILSEIFIVFIRTFGLGIIIGENNIKKTTNNIESSKV